MNMISNIFCNFIDIGFDNYQCTKCGAVISSIDGIPSMICSFVEPDDGCYEHLSDIEKELFCTPNQIDKRYKICQTCEYFLNNTCTQCGCKVVRNLEFKNKLFFKQQECPVGKWLKEN